MSAAMPSPSAWIFSTHPPAYIYDDLAGADHKAIGITRRLRLAKVDSGQTCVSIAGEPPVAIGFALRSYCYMKAVTICASTSRPAIVAAVRQTWKNS